MIANPQSSKMTVEAYLEWESHEEVRHEYINGEVFAMTGGSISHNLIALNLHTALRLPLRPQGCRVFVADMKVQVSSVGPHFYPDVVVSCDERDRTASKFIQYPILTVEVLSSSTEAYDRSHKFAHYRKLPSLQEYVLVSADQISVECFRRSEKQQ